MTEADLNGAGRGLFVTISAGARLGHYEIRSQIGAGGRGEVYLAQDTKLDRNDLRDDPRFADLLRRIALAKTD